MNDHSSNTDIMLRQMTPRELERTRLSIFRSLIAAERRRDLLKIETLALQLSAMARYIRRRGESGTALVEFALLLPLLALFVLGGIDAGFGILDTQTATTAATMACMYGVKDPAPTLAEVEALALKNARFLFCGTPTAQATVSGTELAVTVSAETTHIILPNWQISAVVLGQLP